MIDVGSILHPGMIIPHIKASTREEAIREMVDALFKARPDIARQFKKEDVYERVMEREDMQTTGIGNGLGFPHARINGWREFAVVMGVSEKGIEFNSADKIPVKFLFLMISSQDEPYIILQSMAAIIRTLNNMGYGPGMLDEPKKVRGILEKFTHAQISADEVITARDIERPVIDSVSLDTPIEAAMRTMHLKKLDVLPVVDWDNRFQGELSCQEIFQYGMPDFFKQLNTVSFVRHIDPFERYFRIKRDMKVQDIAIRDVEPVSQDSTLLEMIFQMTVKGRSKLYVVGEDGKLTGAIDRFCIIDKILFF
jgi:PTS system nitrogen regulatory IIA component